MSTESTPLLLGSSPTDAGLPAVPSGVDRLSRLPDEVLRKIATGCAPSCRLINKELSSRVQEVKNSAQAEAAQKIAKLKTIQILFPAFASKEHPTVQDLDQLRAKIGQLYKKLEKEDLEAETNRESRVTAINPEAYFTQIQKHLNALSSLIENSEPGLENRISGRQKKILLLATAAVFFSGLILFILMVANVHIFLSSPLWLFLSIILMGVGGKSSWSLTRAYPINQYDRSLDVVTNDLGLDFQKTQNALREERLKKELEEFQSEVQKTEAEVRAFLARLDQISPPSIQDQDTVAWACDVSHIFLQFLNESTREVNQENLSQLRDAFRQDRLVFRRTVLEPVHRQYIQAT